jgi:hydrogenase maturation protein HypF
VAALVGVGHEVTYEGQAAIELEALSALAHPDPRLPSGYRFDIDEHGVMDPAPLLRRCVADLLAGAPPSLVGRRFHEALAASVVEVAQSVRRDTGVRTVGLTGGVFQNAMLAGLARTSLEASGFDVLVHRVVPPNDGGLALGQVAVAAAGGAKESG